MALLLENLLTVQHNTEQELAALNDRLTSLGKKIFLASNQTENLHLLLQLSVLEGVQNMYTHFHNMTKQHVNQKSQDEADVTTQEAIRARSSTTFPTKQDKAAGIWTSACSEFYRAS